MSDSTGESTYFTAGDCNGRGGCKACGHRSYSMREDAPRCDGCLRIVLRDDGATQGTIQSAGGWSPPMSKEEALRQAREINEDFDRAYFARELAERHERLARDMVRKHPPPYSGNMPSGEMTAENVMAGVMAILREAKAE